MNGILNLEDKKVEPIRKIDPKMIKSIMTEAGESNLKTQEILELILDNEQINPFGVNELKSKVPSYDISNKDAINDIALKIEKLLRERKCKPEGLCLVSDEIYLEAFNELIRQITVDCPERGIILAIIRDEITKSLNSYKKIYDSSLGFAKRREISAGSGLSDLQKKHALLQRKIAKLKNEKIVLTGNLQNMKANFAYLSQKNKQKRDEEIEFHKQQNNNVDDFLQHVKQIRDPLEVKANFEKNRQL